MIPCHKKRKRMFPPYYQFANGCSRSGNPELIHKSHTTKFYTIADQPTIIQTNAFTKQREEKEAKRREIKKRAGEKEKNIKKRLLSQESRLCFFGLLKEAEN